MTMNKIILKSIGLLAVFALGTSCIQETFPEGGTVTESQVSANPNALLAMANAIPVNMVTSYTGGWDYDHWCFGIASLHIATDEMLGDQATMGDNPYYNRYYAWAMDRSQGSTYVYCAYFWEVYYMWIKNCNDIIGAVDPETATADALKALGTAYAYRASFYLDLARLYEPKAPRDTYEGYDVSKVLGLTVPIVTEETTEAEAANNPRVPHDDMYEFILSDLAKAEEYLADIKTGYTAPTIYAVYGLYARTYLEMGAYCQDNGESKASEYYTNAARYAKLVIDESGKKPLDKAQWEDPINGFNTGSSNSSWIWGLTVSTQVIGNIITYTAMMSNEATFGYAPYVRRGIDRKLYESIPDSDFRKHSWLDPELDGYYNYQIAGKAEDVKAFWKDVAMPYLSLKFRANKGLVNDDTDGNNADVLLMRIEEMYFIQAEAMAQNGDISGAQTVLNNLINTRDPEYSFNPSSKRAFLKEMLRQKRVEFWGEGIVFFDYKRLDFGFARGYEGSNHAPVYMYNCHGRSPQWNLVITRTESQSNSAIDEDNNNPDPSNLIKLWPSEWKDAEWVDD